MLGAALKNPGDAKPPVSANIQQPEEDKYFGVTLNKAAFPGLFEDDTKPEDYVPGLLEKLSLVDVKMEPIYKVASSIGGTPVVRTSQI
jgi:hypothetical protein